MFILLLLMVMNTGVEILGIAAIIPVVSITLKSDLSLFENFFFYENLASFSQTENFIFYTFLFVIGVFLLKNFFIIFYNYFLTNFYNNIGKRISNDIFKTYVNLSYKDYLKLKSSKPLFDTTEGVEIFKISLNNLSLFILEILVLSGILLFLISIEPQVSSIIFLILGALSLLVFYIFNKQNKFWGAEVKKNFNFKINILNQTFSSFKNIKIFSCEDFFIEKFDNYNKDLTRYQKIHLFFVTLPKPIFEILIVLILISTLYFLIGFKNISSEVIILNLAIYGVSLFRMYPSVYRLSNCIQKAGYGSSVLDDLTKVYRSGVEKFKEEFITSTNEESFSSKINTLEIKDINFSYNEEEKKVINNLNQKFERNIIYGIRGETGSGKSTFIDLISGLLKPNYGSFFVNGKKISNFNKNWFKKISYVTQNISLLDDTLERNIALAVKEENLDREKIKEVIEVAELSSFNENLLSKKDNYIGELGVKVSGGERQRIGIARALYFDRDIYIFDEATNALDENTEIKILQNIKNYLKDKIIIFVSHKNITLKQCDKIISIKD